MLITLARNAMQIPIPTSNNGIDFTAVLANPSIFPKAAANMVPKPLMGLAPRALNMIAPIISAAKTAQDGIVQLIILVFKLFNFHLGVVRWPMADYKYVR